MASDFSAAGTGQKQGLERPQEMNDQLRIPGKVKTPTLLQRYNYDITVFDEKLFEIGHH